MGQTLTHGIYLPDEGERNCYNGLAGNWSILDGAVGTVAEHTSALAGKAPLVHTHTKSDITDFPVYGTTAGTICEGNDSRLSDARTPVAHTHGKADITDLFNSANTWGSIQTISYAGSNVTIALKNQETDIAASPTRNNWHYVIFYDKNSVSLGGVNYSKRTNGNSRVYLNLRTKNTNNDIIENNIFFETNQEGTDWNLYPSLNAGINLGTSTNKWKTLNGINPGALSLPDYNNVLDVTSNIPVASLDGTTQINLNDYLADKTGWLSIVIDDTAGNSIMVTQGKTGGATAYNNSRTFHTGAQSNGYISVFFPMIAGLSQKAFIKASSLIQMRFYYCLGNV